MSLFPAYDELCNNTFKESTPASGVWLQNNSYAETQEKTQLHSANAAGPVQILIENSTSTATSDASSDNEDAAAAATGVGAGAGAGAAVTAATLNLEFSGNEEFYVDKKPSHNYRQIETLHRPAKPRYHKRYQCIWKRETAKAGTNSKHSKDRYYRMMTRANVDTELADCHFTELERKKIIARTAELNGKVIDEPQVLEHWIELFEQQQKNPYKFTKLSLAQRQLHLLKNAFVHHKSNEYLTKLYVEVANGNYPSNEVSVMLDALLVNDAYNYTLWTAQIMSTQGTMARCSVPDVLHIYERCMRRMHKGNRKNNSLIQVDTDPIMLKLFHNCALFLRQSGNYEQFIALLKLALELNVSNVQFDNFVAKPATDADKTLLEYEELVLQSGLPMHEIWLRVEKLRQAYNFLPYTQSGLVSDPQRCVFNEDICHYIYPLRSSRNLLQLVLIVVQLTKLPFITSHCLSEQLCERIDNMGDLDDIELVFAPVGERICYAVPTRMEHEFIRTLLSLAKEMATGPSFLNHTIGHELYVNCLSELLLKCAEIYSSSSDEPKQRIFITLWFQFARLRLVLEKLSGKLTPEYVRAGRASIRSLLKQSAHRRMIAYYTELALYEHEVVSTDENPESAFKVFENVIASLKATNLETVHVDDSNACVRYAEVLMAHNCPDRAKQVLSGLALCMKSNCSQPSMLMAIERFQSRINALISEIHAKDTQEWTLVQYFQPHEFFVLLKARCLLQVLLNQHTQVIDYLDELLDKEFQANPQSRRRSYFREKIFEIYISIVQLPGFINSSMLITRKLCLALKEFPRNLQFLQRISMSTSMQWHSLRSKLLNSNAGIFSIIYLIAAIRCRYIQMVSADAAGTHTSVAKLDRTSLEITMRNRILNMFRQLTTSSDVKNLDRSSETLKSEPLKRNSLFWRFYLRCLSDERTSFEKTKECLLTALDECPWSKVLYLDGATFVPPEAAHMQDLMMEKSLRIYALPEELQILRE